MIWLLESVAKRTEQQENQAEQRVRLFLTLASASVAVLAFVTQSQKLEPSYYLWVPLTVCFVLLAFGLETIHSLNWKTIYIRINSKLSNTVRRGLAESSSMVAEFSRILDEAEGLKMRSGWFRKTVRGSLPELMYFANSFLFSGMLLTIALYYEWNICLSVSVVVSSFALMFVTQYFYSKWMRDTIPSKWV